eukprot:m51a1_g7586 putative 3 -cyclic-nucleotide phosphodiesterase (907) ;mRNA; r:203501-206384
MLHSQTVITQFFSGVTTVAQLASRTMSSEYDSGSYARQDVTLSDLTYTRLPSGVAIVYDARPTRQSEFYVSKFGVASAEPWPAFPPAAGCPCQDEYDMFLAATAAARGNSSIMGCARACEIAVGLRLSLGLEPLVVAINDKLPASSWRWSRGNGSAQADFGRVWVSYDLTRASGGALTLQSLNSTYSRMHSGKTGNLNSYLAYPRATPGDTSAVWSRPYIISYMHPSAVSVVVPAYSREGYYLGAFEINLRISKTREMLQNLSKSFDIPAMPFLVADNNDVIAGSAEAMQLVFNDPCERYICNIVETLANDDVADTMEQAERGENIMGSVPLRLAGETWLFYHIHLEELHGWKFVALVREKDMFPVDRTAAIIASSVVVPVVVVGVAFAVVLLLVTRHLRGRVRELETRLGTVTSANLIGTPAEDAVLTLLRLADQKRITPRDRQDLVNLVALLSTNKLFKADKDKLKALRLDSETDAYLLDILAKADLPDLDLSIHCESVDCNELAALAHSGAPEADCLVKGASELALLSRVTVTLEGGRVVGLDSWDFDVELVQPTQGRSLFEELGLALMQRGDLVRALGLNVPKLQLFLRTVEQGYLGNPYHRSVHAADVAAAVSLLLSACEAAEFTFTPLERLAAVVAAFVHDYKHPGVNNNFLAATMDPLCFRYNGLNVLESMHCSESMSLLFLDQTLGFADGLSKEDRQDLHRTVCQLVLATDMARHLELTSQFGARVASGNLVNSKPDKLLVMQMMLKMADISNSTRGWPVCQRWAQRVMEEFFLQGDRERSASLAISPFMDRTTTDTPKCQCAFIQYVVQPMVELVAKACPEQARVLAENLATNLSKWRAMATPQKEASAVLYDKAKAPKSLVEISSQLRSINGLAMSRERSVTSSYQAKRPTTSQHI